MVFEPAIPEIKWLHIFALNRLVTGTDARPSCKGQSPGVVSEPDRCVPIITQYTGVTMQIFCILMLVLERFVEFYHLLRPKTCE